MSNKMKKFEEHKQWADGYQKAYSEIQKYLISKKVNLSDKFSSGFNETLDSLIFLIESFPGRLLKSRERFDIFKKNTFMGAKSFQLTRPNLIWERSPHELYTFNFSKESCMVVRVILEDTLREIYPNDKSDLNGLINNNLTGEQKILSHIIRENGNWFSHSPRSASAERIVRFDGKNPDELAFESAKSLNKLLIKWEIKRPIT